MAKYINSWINQVITRLANFGVKGKSRTLKFVPRKKEGGKCLAYRPCVKCGKKNAVVFQAVEDCHVFLTACPSCKQFAYRTTTGPATEAHSTDNRPSEMVVEDDGICVAIKKDGTRCSNKAKEGTKLCGVHTKKDVKIEDHV